MRAHVWVVPMRLLRQALTTKWLLLLTALLASALEMAAASARLMVALDLHEAGVARDLLDQPQRRKGVVGMYHHHSSAARVGAGLLLHRMWDAYTRCLALRPLFTKIMTGVVGTILGDLAAQYGSYLMAGPSKRRTKGGKHITDFRYDFRRLFRLLAYSAALGTPIGHFWFDFLDRCIMPNAPTSALAVLTKLLMDQGLMAPFGTVLFFTTMKVLEGQPRLAVYEVRSKFWGVMKANWAVWPLANLINFALIPPEQRILYVNVLAVAWSAYLSHAANKQQGSGTGSGSGSSPEPPSRVPPYTHALQPWDGHGGSGGGSAASTRLMPGISMRHMELSSHASAVAAPGSGQRAHA